MTTGQCAWVTQSWLTEPISMLARRHGLGCRSPEASHPSTLEPVWRRALPRRRLGSEGGRSCGPCRRLQLTDARVPRPASGSQPGRPGTTPSEFEALSGTVPRWRSLCTGTRDARRLQRLRYPSRTISPNAGFSRKAAKSSSSRARAAIDGASSIARRRWAIAASIRPARLSKQAVL